MNVIVVKNLKSFDMWTFMISISKIFLNNVFLKDFFWQPVLWELLPQWVGKYGFTDIPSPSPTSCWIRVSDWPGFLPIPLLSSPSQGVAMDERHLECARVFVNVCTYLCTCCLLVSNHSHCVFYPSWAEFGQATHQCHLGKAESESLHLANIHFPQWMPQKLTNPRIASS